MGRIAIAGVEHVGMRRPYLLLAVSDLKRGGLINRGRQRPVFLAQIGAPTNSFCFPAVLVFFHNPFLTLLRRPARMQAHTITTAPIAHASRLSPGLMSPATRV